MREPCVPPLARLLTLTEQAYGPSHVEVARTLSNLGSAWFELGEPDKARDLYQRALTIKQRQDGPDHAEVVRTLGNLDNAWAQLGKPDKARNLYQRGLQIQRHHYPNGHPTTTALIRSL